MLFDRETPDDVASLILDTFCVVLDVNKQYKPVELNSFFFDFP